MSYYQGPPQGYPPQGPPQGQYGAPPPPPQGYPPQQQPYGAPPPVGQPQYGQYPPPPGPPPPQHAGYGIPPVAQQYNQGGYPPPMAPGHYPPPQGAPYAPPTGPPQGGYPPPNPPPQTGYAPPPPQQQQGYAPPPQNYGYQPPPPQQYYDASKDVAAIRKATKGFGTDEAALINVLARGNKTAQQMEQLRKSFESQVGKSLLQVIEKETSGWFEYGLRGLILGPVGFDVWLLNRACDGAGTHEDILTEVLVGRTNEEMETIKAEYHRVYHKNLVQVIQGELTFKTERLFNMILAANRTPEPVPVDPHQVESDIKQLYDAGQGRAGTDEIAFCGILMNRSNAAIRQITGGYKHHHRRSLESAILSEFSGHMQETLLQVVHNAVDPMGWDATLIDRAMEGAGTKDERLTYRIVRAYWKGGRPYVTGVKQAYEQKFKKNLIKRVKSETSGDYERLLVAILEG